MEDDLKRRWTQYRTASSSFQASRVEKGRKKLCNDGWMGTEGRGWWGVGVRVRKEGQWVVDTEEDEEEDYLYVLLIKEEDFDLKG